MYLFVPFLCKNLDQLYDIWSLELSVPDRRVHHHQLRPVRPMRSTWRHTQPPSCRRLWQFWESVAYRTSPSLSTILCEAGVQPWELLQCWGGPLRAWPRPSLPQTRGEHSPSCPVPGWTPSQGEGQPAQVQWWAPHLPEGDEITGSGDSLYSIGTIL